MKVTAIIADDLISGVKECTNSSTITEAITIALREWMDIYHIQQLNRQIAKRPVHVNGKRVRELNRSR